MVNLTVHESVIGPLDNAVVSVSNIGLFVNLTVPESVAGLLVN